jgi:hypothetical protein
MSKFGETTTIYSGDPYYEGYLLFCWMASDANVNHPARSQVDQEEAEQTPKQQVGDLKKVMGPDIVGMLSVRDSPHTCSAGWCVC